MGRFFKICTNLSQNWLKLKKLLEKSGDFAQNLAQNWVDWYMKWSLFLEKLVPVWVSWLELLVKLRVRAFFHKTFRVNHV